MITIYKYVLQIVDEQTLRIPQGAQLLEVQTQGRAQVPCIWALIDTNKPLEDRKIAIRGTGHDCAGLEYAPYLGTFQLPGLVFHVFERSR